MEASLIARLEKAVEKLEKLQVGPAGTRAAHSHAPAAAAAPAAPTAAPAAAAGSGATLAEWDHLIAEHLVPVKALVQCLPQEAQQSMQSFERAFQATRRVLEVSAVAKKPDSPEQLQTLLAPVASAMGQVSAASEARRVSCPHHLKVLAEAVAALGFLAYTGPGCGMPPPRQHVADSWQSAEFFSNKLLMEFRGKDDNQVAWVRGLKSFIQQLEQFVVRNAPTGLRFDPAGQPLAAAMAVAATAPGAAAAAAAPSKPVAAPAAPAAAAAAPAPAARKPGGPPPPPPPPGPPPKPLSPDELAASSSGRGGGGAAGGGGDVTKLFAELSKGEAITSGLRKVTDDMKAKNRPDRSGAVPGSSAATAPSSSSATPPSGKAAAAAPSGPPKLELQGIKWSVENWVGRQDLVLENEAPKNSVYVYGCRDCVLQVKGKVNAVSLDKCVRVGVVFGDVISSVEAVNCTSVQLQVTGCVPTLSIEKTDGAQLFVSKRCAADPNFQVVTAKCSAVNVVVVPDAPQQGQEGAGGQEVEDPQEHPVPEQFISTFQGGKLVTVAAAHSGA
ncbi:hypothetical protein HYH02_013112 [Chlamydomonas schloesseri]|uniref:C-CAP/cofactor C-like domain-containing protein n=1 Tax=Chlamydomonas schloesseri TaxID=2026947 RepID=A0A835VWK8_9CHLO|nr:hypothetical protein HYH02_013112 [Chlamydomonas schloesseri]|eukprot:KAG2432042.1 hypothetical protein HYH02_013112 [Chlamydomonas schloesseri]